MLADIIFHRQAYPFPAFVLTHPSSTTSAPSHAVTAPFPSPPSTPYSGAFPKLLYANDRWHAAARGRPLHDCLSLDDQPRLLCWLHHCIERAGASTSKGVASDPHDDPHCDDDDDDDKPPALASFDFVFPSRCRRLDLVASVIPGGLSMSNGSSRSTSGASTSTTVLVTSVPRPRWQNFIAVAEPPRVSAMTAASASEAAMQFQAYSERERREQEQAKACAAAAAAVSAASSPVASGVLRPSPAGGHLREGVRTNDALAAVPVYVGTLEDKGTLEYGGHAPSESAKYKPGACAFLSTTTIVHSLR